MGSLRKPLAMGLVWLTAISTALAGTPALLCHCTDGSVRLPGVLDSWSPNPPCCAQTSKSETKKPHCPHCRTHKSTSTPTAWNSAQCHRSIAQPAVFIEAEPRVTMADNVSIHASAALAPAILIVAKGSAGAFTACDPDQQPPPTDRIIAFQHFLI